MRPPRRDRVLLFDWRGDGHHPLYVARFIEALAGTAVIVAGPTHLAERLPSGVETIALPNRPSEEHSRWHTAALAREELSLLARAALQSRATRVVHMYTDPVLPHWPRASFRLPPTTIVVFFAAAHYPREYHSGLTLRERAREARTELALALWRRRSEAQAILALDEANAARWRHSRVPAYWLPEPPVPQLTTPPAPRRDGAVMYGAIAPRKGFSELAQALLLGDTPTYPVTICGPVRQDYKADFDVLCNQLIRRGVDLRLQLHHHAEEDGLRALSTATCVVLPYRRHAGMSRVLLEAASVGTPVVVSEFGLLGHLTRHAGLGLAVRPDEPAAFRSALDAMASQEPGPSQTSRLQTFAARYDKSHFRTVVRNAVNAAFDK